MDMALDEETSNLESDGYDDLVLSTRMLDKSPKKKLLKLLEKPIKQTIARESYESLIV